MPDLINVMLDQIGSTTILYIILGTFLGIIVGAIPGLTAVLLISLTLPLTFFMDSHVAMPLLIGMYVGGVSGALITATLLNIPGTPSAVVTTLDGYPMSQAGRPGEAIGWGIIASFTGGLISWVFLATLASPLSRLAIRFGPFDYFGLILMSLFVIAAVSKGNMLKGVLAGFLGMMFTLPGVDPIDGNYRFTFDIHALENGFRLLPALVGLFAGGQVLTLIMSGEPTASKSDASKNQKLSGILIPIPAAMRQLPNMLRSSLIGTVVGILPGIGANIGSILSYTAARSVSKTPQKFGTGEPAGIVASEAGNNATIGGALIPLIAMGIPGSVVDAVLIGAMAIHNVHPGPFLFRDEPNLVYGIISAAFIANILMFFMMIFLTRYIIRLVDVPQRFLLSGILVFCVVGTYALGGSWFDVWVMLGFSLLGYIFERADLSLAAFVIGMVLAPLAESKLRISLQITDGAILPLFTENPIGSIFVFLTIGIAVASIIRQKNPRFTTTAS